MSLHHSCMWKKSDALQGYEDGCFKTTSLEDAQRVFDSEVNALEATYTNEKKLSYSPTEYEKSHAIYCSIMAIDLEGEDSDVEFIEDSDFYYNE